MIIRTRRITDNFSVLPNDLLRDQRLSYRTRGILCDLLSRPDDWSPRADHLAEHSPTEGRRAVLTALKEATQAGYVVRRRERDDAGRLRTVTYVYDRPQGETGVRSEHSGESDTHDSAGVRSPAVGQPAAGQPNAGQPNAGQPAVGQEHSLRSTDKKYREEVSRRRTEHEDAREDARDLCDTQHPPILHHPPEDVVELCRILARRVRDNGYPVPKRDTKAHRGWLVTMDRLVRLGQPGDGGHTPAGPAEVEEVIRWATGDHEPGSGRWTGWADVIRSPANLRQHYVTLLHKARARSSPNGNGRGGPRHVPQHPDGVRSFGV